MIGRNSKRVLCTCVAYVLTLCIDPQSAAFIRSCVDSAALASSPTLLFSDIARSCLDRPVVFLLTLSSTTSIPVAQRSWTRAFVAVNSSWRCSWTQ